MDVLDEPLDRIQMSARLRRLLAEVECETLRDATSYTRRIESDDGDVRRIYANFLRSYGFGRKTLNELHCLLRGGALLVPPPIPKPPRPPRPMSARDIAIVRARQQHPPVLLRVLAEQYGISPERVRQIVGRAARRAKLHGI